MLRRIVFTLVLASIASASAAQQVGSDDSTFEDGILVTSSDVLTCPYRLVEPVSANVTEDYGLNTRPKIFNKLRDQAKKLAADAVVLVQKGSGHMTAFAWNRRTYAGRAIRYVDRNCAPSK